MPLFMDRHDDPNITPERGAEAHRADIRLQDHYGCKFRTYWLDQRRGHVFCLVEAPSREHVEEVHRNAHGEIPNQIIEVEERLGELFLGRITDPDHGPTAEDGAPLISESPFRTILSAEWLPSQAMPSPETRPDGPSARVLRDVLTHHGGQEVQHATGKFLASFASVSGALECAIEMQQMSPSGTGAHRNGRRGVSIGICTGSPVTQSHKFFGDMIRLAGRLCRVGRDGQIVVASSVRDALTDALTGRERGSWLRLLSASEEGFLCRLFEVLEGESGSEAFSVERCCRRIGTSKAQLYRRVRSLTGLSPNAFLREYRLRQALPMLSRREGNVAEIAFETGFGNASYFSKCFRARFGIRPSEYAKS